MEQQKNFKYIVRIANTDLKGEKSIAYALRKVKGVSYMFANTLCSISAIEKSKKAGNLSDAEVNKLNEILKDPAKFGVPSWLFNRRRDRETGKDTHIVSATLAFTKDNDIKRLKKIRSYKGVRHTSGLPVRGQKTRSNFRKKKGKVALGVQRRSGAKSGK